MSHAVCPTGTTTGTPSGTPNARPRGACRVQNQNQNQSCSYDSLFLSKTKCPPHGRGGSSSQRFGFGATA